MDVMTTFQLLGVKNYAFLKTISYIRNKLNRQDANGNEIKQFKSLYEIKCEVENYTSVRSLPESEPSGAGGSGCGPGSWRRRQVGSARCPSPGRAPPYHNGYCQFDNVGPA